MNLPMLSKCYKQSEPASASPEWQPLLLKPGAFVMVTEYWLLADLPVPRTDPAEGFALR
jgi:hypothetical protein